MAEEQKNQNKPGNKAEVPPRKIDPKLIQKMDFVENEPKTIIVESKIKR